MSWFYEIWGYTNLDNTFVAYYENSDYYRSHRDIAVISVMYWLWEEPKSFEGGNVHLTDYDIEIPLERNQLMIMPSSTHHAVDEIKMIRGVDKLSGMGRYCVVRFLKLN
jgi:Rps23 Pro-64 3,4-dihydroxylase Tpa1-like proline 4-hydroxylase